MRCFPIQNTLRPFILAGAIRMTLRRFQIMLGLSDEAVCERLGIAASTMRKWNAGLAKPGGRLIVELHILTHGAVRFEDWYGDEFERQAAILTPVAFGGLREVA